VAAAAPRRTLGQESHLSRTVVVTSSDDPFGLIRMIEMMVDGVCPVNPLLNEQEARAWLAASD
jgi:hypothetical protein